MVLALLLARQGVRVTVLEAAHDFDRSFRGDTLHPASLELMAALGLAGRLLELEHTRAGQARFISDGVAQTVADFSRLRTPYPYLAVMKQSRFLDFIGEELTRFPHARMELGARVDGLLEEGGQTLGVRYRQGGEAREVRATLTVGADGRASKVRSLAGLELRRLSPGQDVLWFSLPKRAGDRGGSIDLHMRANQCIVTTDHGERWQVGVSIPKGGYRAAREAGVGVLREAVARTIPWLASRLHLLADWKQLRLLSVEVARAPKWWRPGLLLIGDAAHPISPIGGMGINMAVQDAVAAANKLTGPLQRGRLRPAHLRAVQRSRAWQIAALQAQQVVEERGISALDRGGSLHRPMLALRLLHRLPGLRLLPGYVTAYGLLPVRLRAGYRAVREG